MLTLYTVAYNEDMFIQFMIDHYREKFPNCNIVVYDNMSTDNTVYIAKKNGAQVIQYDTNNQINDSKYLEIKNNCWKNATTDWVIICDADELLNINQEQLLEEESRGNTIISTEGYNMVNMEDNYDLYNIKYGARATQYDKSYLFNKKYIKEINYEVGCHKSNPIGTVKLSDNKYPAYHYNFVNIDLCIEKYKAYGKRLSYENLKYGWGNHYLNSEEKIRSEFNEIRSKAIKLF